VVAEIVGVADPKRIWRLVALRGGLSVVFGLVALLWPDITVLALSLLFGAWALLQGISALVAAARLGRARVHAAEWLPLVLIGVLGAAAALATVFWPALTVLAPAVLVAVLLIGFGAAEIALAVRLRRAIRGEVFLILGGMVALLTGLAILIWPSLGILALTVVVGTYALVAGILMLVAAMRLRGAARDRRAGARRGPTMRWAQPCTVRAGSGRSAVRGGAAVRGCRRWPRQDTARDGG
jgi:uncharacterized membrane protein HdeD (DUF308 family)